VDRIIQKTSNPLFVNFILSFQSRALEAIIEAGAPAATFSWGIAPELIDFLHGNNVAARVQVGTAYGARGAISYGADFGICQGIEAGGHVQSTIELATLLPQVVLTAGKVPVFAAGGLATDADIAWANRLGASGVMVGTSFVATKESNARQHYKESIVNSSGSDTEFTNWVITRARKKHCSIVQLTSDKQRVDAIRFYEELGFIATHEGFKLKL
jgi:nitronate monooxygenase